MTITKHAPKDYSGNSWWAFKRKPKRQPKPKPQPSTDAEFLASELWWMLIVVAIMLGALHH